MVGVGVLGCGPKSKGELAVLSRIFLGEMFAGCVQGLELLLYSGYHRLSYFLSRVPFPLPPTTLTRPPPPPP